MFSVTLLANDLFIIGNCVTEAGWLWQDERQNVGPDSDGRFTLYFTSCIQSFY